MIHVHPDHVLQLVSDRHTSLRRQIGASRLRRGQPSTKRRHRHRHR